MHEKYGVDDKELLLSLRDEEASLMTKVANYMMMQEKTAAEADELQKIEARLGVVRSKITELDLKKE